MLSDFRDACSDSDDVVLVLEHVAFERFVKLQYRLLAVSRACLRAITSCSPTRSAQARLSGESPAVRRDRPATSLVPGN